MELTSSDDDKRHLATLSHICDSILVCVVCRCRDLLNLLIYFACIKCCAFSVFLSVFSRVLFYDYAGFIFHPRLFNPAANCNIQSKNYSIWPKLEVTCFRRRAGIDSQHAAVNDRTVLEVDESDDAYHSGVSVNVDTTNTLLARRRR